MWIAKLGGSLAGSERLRPWLAALAARSDLVLVPGGGPFADAVRAAQPRMGFDDGTAHHLSLLAMEQYGRALCALHPGLAPVATAQEIRDCLALSPGPTPVWMPVAMALADPRLPRVWDLTSDSLAAWLCGRLGGRGLVLVKAVALPPQEISLEALARVGIVDPLLPRIAQEAGVAVRLISAARLGDMDSLLERMGS